MSGTGRAGEFRVRRKVDEARSVNNFLNTFTAGVPEPLNILIENDNHTSDELFSELMDINISLIEAMQDHSRETD